MKRHYKDEIAYVPKVRQIIIRDKTGKPIEVRLIMQDETGRPIEARIEICETPYVNYNQITLIIVYLDDYSYKVYRPILFFKYAKCSFNTLYEICKINDYEEGKLRKKNN